ncbi:TonB-dependent receptor plug domain-containing protein [Pseudoalteromonas ruthenica]|uniref:TonB-dependent receptor n=1 Tax=Pseudoalteromonas ruthenica TaxID=151081 RepID=A0A0F4PU09_9GAMM|nr:TonB-dependent receptor [Pseudoalteromonas ruthenica]KJY98945.1 TonB-dependent receptor [Pseudoalteromonas ruthenica]KJZ01397.1 TonB-dependent receptor [Pseudoalteromonas ruthenica]TMO89819.1 TonB-dependent receptor [Pseudoalteromonas ruthenica]TMO91670.1 TonB-dependent receptor [Pseudoalteromonas ruthenica]TMO99207.1 TonB-dependent receptor [Pseudoalteromonas ruthenica]
MKKTQLGLAVAAALPMFSSVQAIAADSSAEAIEKIQVTGSRIKRADMETASPVTLIGADDIKAMGATSIDSVLQKMTATGGAMTNPGINNGSGGNARIDLRGLGAQRTLVLVNGRRMINSGTGAASTVDLNTIPVSMIKSVEVLKDGASAVYGTDAVAGVVNIILKDNFEGLDMNLNTAMSGEGDAEESSFDITVGGSFDRGNVVIGLQYTDRGEASQADREFSKCPIAEAGGELNCNGGSVYAQGGHIWQDGVIGDVNKKGESVDEDGNPITSGLALNDSGLSGMGGLHPFTDADRYNFAPDSYLYTPMERLNLTGIANYELTDDTRLFTEFTYSKRWSQQQMAPQPIWFGFKYDEAMGDSLLSQTYNSKVDRDGDGIADRDADGEYITETANYAYGDQIFYGRRMSDTGPRFFEQSVDTVRAVIGAEGFVGDYAWDVSANFGRNDSVDKLSNLHNVGSLTDSIMFTNDEGQVEGTFNPLDQAAWTSEDFRKNIYTEVNNGGSQLFILSASVSGEMFEMPAGYSAFAAGVERRQEKAWYTPDSLTAQGLANDPAVEPTSGGFDVNEAYVEFALPLLADVPFAEMVDLSAAIRAFDYSTFGSDETWKLGLTWKVNEELMLRSVVSTAFRAPTVDELYSGNSPSFEQVEFPGAQDQAEVTVGGNQELMPEEADTLTAGLVYEPSWFEGFSMTLDYYDIEIENAITEVDNQYIVDTCLEDADKNSGLALCQSANVTIDSTGRIIFNNQLQNIGSEQTSGYDLNLKYTFEAAGLNWRTSLDTTFLDEYIVQATEEPVDYAGLITSGTGGYAEIKSNFTLNVSGDNWDMQYQARYIAGMDSFSCLEKDDCYAPTTPSVTYHDLSGSYIVNDAVTLTGGVNNLFDKQPPYYSGNNDSNTDPYTYDVLGRRFFAGVNVKF